MEADGSLVQDLPGIELIMARAPFYILALSEAQVILKRLRGRPWVLEK
jgi:hypothetical protein